MVVGTACARDLDSLVVSVNDARLSRRWVRPLEGGFRTCQSPGDDLMVFRYSANWVHPQVRPR